MSKFFVVSDIHGFFDEFQEALTNAGYDKNNPDHYLISCGDNWDRGPKNTQVFQFLNLNPRTILIKGNHESLFVECCDRGYFESHDISNGTVATIEELGDPQKSGKSFDDCCAYARNRVNIFLEKMVNFYETKNYIFVHGYIPAISSGILPPWYVRSRHYDYDAFWRQAKQFDWEDARWYNGIDMAIKHKIKEEGKTIVFGHWHCSYAHALFEEKSEFGNDADFSPYYGDGFIAIDGCTAFSHKVNVVVIEDEFDEKYEEGCEKGLWKAIM